MIEAIKNFLSRKPKQKEPVAKRPRLAPPLIYYTMDIVESEGEYNDEAFYRDLDTLERPYKVPEGYEEVE